MILYSIIGFDSSEPDGSPYAFWDLWDTVDGFDEISEDKALVIVEE